MAEPRAPIVFDFLRSAGYNIPYLVNTIMEERRTGIYEVDLDQYPNFWRKNPLGFYEASLYPRANFTIQPLSGGADLSLRTVDHLNLKELRLTFRNGVENYYLNPHLFIPNMKLWISDGHRYLSAMLKLAELTGISTKKILSIDLDYFARLPDAKIYLEVQRLLKAGSAAADEFDLVIADMHEDLPVFSQPRNVPTNYGEVIAAIDKNEIRDENFIPFLGFDKAVIIKPSLSEFSQALGERKSVVVMNSDQLLNGQDSTSNTSLVDRFDVIHVCTSPCYINSGKAFTVLQLLYQADFGKGGDVYLQDSRSLTLR